jgi:hypothetical protein
MMINKNLEIHSLICNKDLYLAINNYKSLQKFDEFKNVPIYLHDDGSLTSSDRKSLNEIRNINFIDRGWADIEIKNYLVNHPNCLEYRLGSNRIHLWHKIKTFDYFFFSKTKKILCLDTDLLFINKPNNIIKLLTEDTPFYFPDVQSSYCFNEPKSEVEVLKNVNTGLFYIPSEDYYNIDDLEFALSNLIRNGVNYFPSWIEQSAFAHMFYKNGRYLSLDIEKYRIPYFQGVDVEKSECLHFVSYPLVRELYPQYLEYLDYDVNKTIYSKKFLINYKHIQVPLNVNVSKSNENLIFKYDWDLDKTKQKFLSHEFSIEIGDNKYNFKKDSEKSGFFMVHTNNSNKLVLKHSYEWFGEYDWKILDVIEF